jgi:hypothetical protein
VVKLQLNTVWEQDGIALCSSSGHKQRAIGQNLATSLASLLREFVPACDSSVGGSASASAAYALQVH